MEKVGKPYKKRPSRRGWTSNDDQLVPIRTERLRAALTVAGVGCSALAGAIGERQQTVDIIARGGVRRTRLSRVRKIARHLAPGGAQWQELAQWITGEREALIRGSRRPPVLELETYWSSLEIGEMFRTALASSAPPALGAARSTVPETESAEELGKQFRFTFTVLLALTRPDLWRAWLLSEAPPLSDAEGESAARYLAEAFRILLAPLRDGAARVSPRAIKALAELGAGVEYIDS